MKHVNKNENKDDINKKIKKDNKTRKESDENIKENKKQKISNVKTLKEEKKSNIKEDFDSKTIKKKHKINDFLNKKTDFKVYELILFAVLISIVSIFLTVVVYHDITTNNKSDFLSSKSSDDANLAEFEEVYELINDSYYKKVNKKTLVEGAINGMLESLDDPHTSYFNKSETENFNELMNGSYEGIGAEISLDNDGNIIVFSVFKDSPAYEAGLKFNDIIEEVNGKSTDGMTTTQVVALIKDNNKKTASIKIKRDGTEMTFEVEKKVVVIDSVESKTYDVSGKKIGYVLVNNFANNTYEQFKENIEELEAQNIKGLVIDVRGNSGGYLHSVTDMLDMFLPKDTIIYQIADRKTTYKYTATTNESRNYPIAVLVNESSASASEILAIGLKEAYGADVVGTTTYGKGTVQTTKNLSSGAMIKYTIQKWLSPDGNWINDVGVKPTVGVELSEEYLNNPVQENDNQLRKALEVVANK